MAEHVESKVAALRVVIDSSSMQSDELRVFLTLDPGNEAVLTEFAWIEAYKENALASITQCMGVLGEFPRQVLVLKSNQAIAALDPRAPGLAKRMARPRGRAEFAGTVQALRQAAAGDSSAREQVLEHGRRAAEHIHGATLGVPEILQVMPEMQEQLLTAGEVKRWRSGGPMTAVMRAKILGAAEQTAQMLYAQHPKKPPWPSKRSLIDAFLYRYSLGTVLYLLRWIESGSQLSTKHDRVRNDFIDLTFVTLATYFNGLMTDDSRARSLYLELSSVLSFMGARIPAYYVELFRDRLVAGLPADGSSAAEER